METVRGSGTTAAPQATAQAAIASAMMVVQFMLDYRVRFIETSSSHRPSLSSLRAWTDLMHMVAKRS